MKKYFFLISIIFLLLSCSKKDIHGTVNFEEVLPQDIELTFSIVNSDDSETPVYVKVGEDGKFSFKANSQMKGIKYKLSKFSYNQDYYKEPVLVDVYNSKTITTDNLPGFYFFDSDREVDLKKKHNSLFISWKAVPFKNSFYSIRFYDYNGKIIKEIYTKENFIFVELNKGDTNSHLDDVLNAALSLPMVVKNDELIKGNYQTYLTIFIREEKDVATLSIQEIDGFINDNGEFITKYVE
jgi:hypothetical protein